MTREILTELLNLAAAHQVQKEEDNLVRCLTECEAQQAEDKDLVACLAAIDADIARKATPIISELN